MEKKVSFEDKLSFGNFYKLEKKYDLFSLQYKGVNYWQLIRFDIHTQLTFSHYNVSNGESVSNLKQEMLGAFRYACKTLLSWKKLPKADLIRIRPTVQIGSDGTFCDRQFDYMQLEKDAKIADVYALGKYSKVPEAADITMALAEASFFLGKIRRKLFGKGRIDGQQERILRQFFSELEEMYQVHFSVDEVISEAQYQAENYLCYRNCFLKLFRKMKPRAILLYPHYDQHMFAAVAAAKELGIKSIELQHGEIVDHCAYWYEDTTDNGKILPDYFFSYGQWWIDHIRIPECVTSVAVGNPYLDNQVAKYPTNIQGKTITFFSNVISGNDLIELIDSCYEEMQNLGYRIVFKLHPGEFGKWRNMYPFLVEHPEIEVIESESVYKLISESNVVMGLRSTVFYEALVYEDVRIALDYKGKMKFLLDTDLVHPVNGKEDFLAVLQEESQNGEQKSNEATEMWKANGAENAVNLIRKILFSQCVEN